MTYYSPSCLWNPLQDRSSYYRKAATCKFNASALTLQASRMSLRLRGYASGKLQVTLHANAELAKSDRMHNSSTLLASGRSLTTDAGFVALNRVERYATCTSLAWNRAF